MNLLFLSLNSKNIGSIRISHLQDSLFSAQAHNEAKYNQSIGENVPITMLSAQPPAQQSKRGWGNDSYTGFYILRDSKIWT